MPIGPSASAFSRVGKPAHLTPEQAAAITASEKRIRERHETEKREAEKKARQEAARVQRYQKEMQQMQQQAFAAKGYAAQQKRTNTPANPTTTTSTSMKDTTGEPLHDRLKELLKGRGGRRQLKQ